MGGDWKRRGDTCYCCFLLSWDVSVIGIYFLWLKEREGGAIISIQDGYAYELHMDKEV